VASEAPATLSVIAETAADAVEGESAAGEDGLPNVTIGIPPGTDVSTGGTTDVSVGVPVDEPSHVARPRPGPTRVNVQPGGGVSVGVGEPGTLGRIAVVKPAG